MEIKEQKVKRKTNYGMLSRLLDWTSSVDKREEKKRYGQKEQFNNRCVSCFIFAVIILYILIALVHIRYGIWQAEMIQMKSNQSQFFHISIGSFRRCSEFEIHSNVTTIELTEDSQVVDAFIQFHIIAETQPCKCDFIKCKNIPQGYTDYRKRLKTAEFSSKISNLSDLADRFKTKGLIKIIRCLDESK